MMEWFKENAVAIQALSSVAGFLVTIILAGLTYWYVQVTRDLAASSLEQVKYIRETARVLQQQCVRALGALAVRLRVDVDNLPDNPQPEELSEFLLLTESDITDLETLARQVNDQALTSASEAVGGLRVILGMIQSAKEKRFRGERFSPMESPEEKDWRTARGAAERGLRAIEEVCQQVTVTG